MFSALIFRSQILFQLQTVVLAVILCAANTAWGQQTARVNFNAEKCEPIAKVITRDNRRWPFLTQFCKEEIINSTSGIEIFCYLNGNIIKIFNGAVGEKCLVAKAQIRGCSFKKRGNCPKIKGPDEHNAPSIISPSGAAISNSRPTISWTATAAATSYIVHLKGKGVDWSIETSNTQLPYPEEQPGMQPGNVYELNIIVNKEGSLIVATPAVFTLVAQHRVEKVKSIINHLESLNLPPDDLAIDINYVYEAENLLNEAIEVLSARSKAGSQNPVIYRLLGDLYMELDLPDFAGQAYRRAVQLAKIQGNYQELIKAQAGADMVYQIQLPIKTNGAQ